MKNELVEKTNEELLENIYKDIANIIKSNKEKMIYQINDSLVNTYFLIGKVIVENEQNGNIRAEYGKELLKSLSKKLTERFGSGFSRSNLQNMRLFFEKYKKCQPLVGKLSWSHYVILKTMMKEVFMRRNVLILNGPKENLKDK